MKNVAFLALLLSCAGPQLTVAQIAYEEDFIALFEDACLRTDYDFLTKDLKAPYAGGEKYLGTNSLSDDALYGTWWSYNFIDVPIIVGIDIVPGDQYLIGMCTVFIPLSLDEDRLIRALTDRIGSDNLLEDSVRRGTRIVAFRVNSDPIGHTAFILSGQTSDGATKLQSHRGLAEIQK